MAADVANAFGFNGGALAPRRADGVPDDDAADADAAVIGFFFAAAVDDAEAGTGTFFFSTVDELILVMFLYWSCVCVCICKSELCYRSIIGV